MCMSVQSRGSSNENRDHTPRVTVTNGEVFRKV